MKKSEAKSSPKPAACAKKASSSARSGRREASPPPQPYQKRKPKPNQTEAPPYSGILEPCVHEAETGRLMAVSLQATSCFHAFLRNVRRHVLSLEQHPRFLQVTFSLPTFCFTYYGELPLKVATGVRTTELPLLRTLPTPTHVSLSASRLGCAFVVTNNDGKQVNQTLCLPWDILLPHEAP